MPQRPWFRRFVLVFVVAIACPAALWAQGAKDQSTLTGKISQVERKGKTTLVKLATETGEQTLELAQKTTLEIVSTGDDGFLTPGLYVRIDSVESNKSQFGHTFEVFPKYEGKIPPASAVKPPPQPGQSQNRHIVTGEIVKYEPPKEGEKYGRLELRQTPKATLPVYVEPGHTVKVVVTDPSQLEAGQSATAVGRKAGDKIAASKFTVATGARLKAEESLSNLTGKKPKK